MHNMAATPPPPPSPPHPMPLNTANLLATLNADRNLDFLHHYNNFYGVDLNNGDPYENCTVASEYYDMNSLCNVEALSKNSIFLSVNIQSLQSKFEQLKQQIIELRSKGLTIDVIALQEVWEVKYPEQLCIPGFQKLVCKTRSGMRGGGVGF